MRNLFLFMGLLGSSWLGCGQFESPADPKTPSTQLQGSAILPDGTPAIGFEVYLVNEDGSNKVAQTNDLGKFNLDSAPTGKTKLVLNNHKGMGLLEDVVLYSHGENSFPGLVVAELTQWPEIVDIPGVGYEERITKTAQDYLYPIFNDEGTKAYAARQLPGMYSYDIVEIETATGEEKILFANLLMEASDRPLRLIGNRLLVFETCDWSFCYPGTNYLSLYDVQNNYDFTKSVPGQYLRWLKSAPDKMTWIANNTLYAIADINNRVNSGYNSGDEMRVSWLISIKLDIPWAWPFFSETHLVRDKFYSYFSALVWDDNQLIYSADRHCTDASEEWMNCSEEEKSQENDGRSEFYVVNLQTKEERLLTVLPDMIRHTFAASPSNAVLGGEENKSLVVLNNYHDPDAFTRTISAIDLQSGAIRELFRSEATDMPRYTFLKLWNLGAEDQVATLLNSDPGDGSGLWTGVGTLEINSGTITLLPNQIEINGETRLLCQEYDEPVGEPGSYPIIAYAPRCEVETIPGSTNIRIRDTIMRKNDLSLGIIVDFSLDGAPLHKRIVHFGRNESFPTMRESPDKQFEAMLGRNPETGFNQVYSRTLEGDANLEQLTFLPSEHQGAVFSEDGKWIYSFTTDPISGYRQLFRIETGESLVD